MLRSKGNRRSSACSAALLSSRNNAHALHSVYAGVCHAPCANALSRAQTSETITKHQPRRSRRTVSTVDPFTVPELARIVEIPVPTAAAKPVLLIVATEVFEEPQVTEFVRFFVEPSL